MIKMIKIKMIQMNRNVTFVRSECERVVEWIVGNRMAQPLKMNSNLMCSASLQFAVYNTEMAVRMQALEFGSALFAGVGHEAEAELLIENVQSFVAHRFSLRKNALEIWLAFELVWLEVLDWNLLLISSIRKCLSYPPPCRRTPSSPSGRRSFY